MSMKVLIAMVGITPWPAINSIWAAIEVNDYQPDLVYLLTSGKQGSACAEKVANAVKIIIADKSKKCDTKIVESDPDDPASSYDKISAILDSLKSGTTDVEISMDITSGRKMETVGAILAGYHRKGLKHIFYLSIDGRANPHRECPLLMIPLTYHSSKDLLRRN